MHRELITLIQGSKYTTRYVLKTQQLPLQVTHTCVQLRKIKRQSSYKHPKETCLLRATFKAQLCVFPSGRDDLKHTVKHASPKPFPPT